MAVEVLAAGLGAQTVKRATIDPQTIALVSVICILGITYSLGIVYSPSRMQNRAQTGPLFPELPILEVQQIRLHTPEGELFLVRGIDEWEIIIDGQEYPGHNRHIQSLLDLLASVNLVRTVAASPDAYSAFGLGEDRIRRIILLDEGENDLAHVLVGKRDGQDGGSFVRVDGYNQVVLLNKSLDFYLDAPTLFWSNLRLFPEDLKAEQIVRIAIRGHVRLPEQGELYLDYLLEKDIGAGNIWITGPGSGQRSSRKLDSSEVDSLANAISVMEGLAFADERIARSQLLEKPAAEIDFTTQEGKQYRLLVFEPTGGEQIYYTKSSESAYLFPTAYWRLSLIFKPLTSLEEQ